MKHINFLEKFKRWKKIGRVLEKINRQQNQGGSKAKVNIKLKHKLKDKKVLKVSQNRDHNHGKRNKIEIKKTLFHSQANLKTIKNKQKVLSASRVELNHSQVWVEVAVPLSSISRHIKATQD